MAENKDKLEVAVFGGGCFWCTEGIFARLRGVESVQSGYTGGHTDNPTYEQVSSGDTGHVEAIKITFDPEIINYRDLLNVFFATHDPTTVDQQGSDMGTQYRSAIFGTTEMQEQEAEDFIQRLEDDQVFPDPIVTEINPLTKFWPAENYHQRYYEQNENKPKDRQTAREIRAASETTIIFLQIKKRQRRCRLLLFDVRDVLHPFAVVEADDDRDGHRMLVRGRRRGHHVFL